MNCLQWRAYWRLAQHLRIILTQPEYVTVYSSSLSKQSTDASRTSSSSFLFNHVNFGINGKGTLTVALFLL